LTGRLQADATYFDADQGDYERLDWRRFRFGFKTSLFGDFVLQSEVDLDLNQFDRDDLDDTYNRFTDFYLGWSRSDAFTLKLGKQSAPFTLDGATSSKKLMALERSTVATNLWFPTEYFTGAAALGKIDQWQYHAGIYSSSGDSEFGSFDSGYFGLVSLGYDFSDVAGLDTALVRADYVYNDPDYSGDVGTRDLRQVATLASKFEKGRVGLWSDLSFGDGIGDQGDLFGLQLMPYYDFSDRWQAVFRYSFVNGSGDNSVRLNRYESRIESGRSDTAQEFFLGLNTYLYGHKLKWQNGVEYTHASDRAGDGGEYAGWGLSSGIRLSW
jgi:phosphate-selective porin OprO/OprP